MLKRFVIICFLPLLANCVPNYQETASDTASQYVPSYPENYNEQITDLLFASLKDPDTVKGFKITEPKIGTLNYGLFMKGPEGKTMANRHFYACATYNAKNSYGGYVGYKTNAYFFDATGSFIKSTGKGAYRNQYGESWDCGT